MYYHGNWTAGDLAPAAFPELIPEPQLISFRGDVLRRPSGLSLGSLPPEAAEIGREFAAAMGPGDYPVTLEMDPGFSVSQAPESAQDEAYELEIRPEGAYVRARALPGMRWGLATLRQVLQATPQGATMPAASLLDWPTMGTRGMFLENKWGPDLMSLDDWRGVIDYLAERKMNVLGIGLYGCWCLQYDGQCTEFLMAPVPGHPELATPKTIRWYSPSQGRWQEIDYLPRMFQEDFLGDVVAHGRRRGVQVIPCVNSLGHNTLVPRLILDLASKDECGNPRDYCYCLSNPRVISFVTEWYVHIFRTYFQPYGVDTFHIQLDEVWDEFCQCEDCRRQPCEKMLQDYVVALAEHLVSAGVKNVVLYNDQFTRHMDALTDDFLARLRERGLFDHLVMDWWEYSNDHILPGVHPRLGRGLRSWVKPMACYFNWSQYGPNHGNIALMLEMGHAEGAEGVLSYSVFDPAWGFDYDLLAEYAWNFRGAGPVHRFARKWAHARVDDQVLEALRLLDQAATTEPFWPRDLLPYYWYTYPREGLPYPRHYPAEALDRLPDSTENLEIAASMLRQARSLLAQHADGYARGLLAEAARAEAYAVFFNTLVCLRRAIRQRDGLSEEGCAKAGELLSSVDRATAALVDAMALTETHKPSYVRPACLRDLSVLYEFLEQLRRDVEEATMGRRAWGEVRWHVAIPVAQRRLAPVEEQ